MSITLDDDFFDYDIGGSESTTDGGTFNPDPGTGGQNLLSPELKSLTFNGTLGKVNAGILISAVTPGQNIYLNSDLTPATSATGNSFPVVSISGTGPYNVNIIKDNQVLPLLAINAGTTVYVQTDNWAGRSVGTAGWLLSSEGNAIFSNVAIRGDINATSGTFNNLITVGSGTNKIKINGTSSDSTTYIGISSGTPTYNNTNTPFYVDATGRFSLGSGLVWNPTAPATLQVNGILRGFVNDTTAAPLAASNYMGFGRYLELTGQSGTVSGTTLTVSDTSQYSTGMSLTKTSGTGTFAAGTTISAIVSSTQITLSQSATVNGSIVFSATNALDGIYGIGMKINTNNYWFVDGTTRFKVGSTSNFMSYTSNNDTLTVTGKIQATSGYIGSSSNGWTINQDSFSYTPSSENALATYDSSFENQTSDSYWTPSGLILGGVSGYFSFDTYTSPTPPYGSYSGGISVYNSSSNTSITISSVALDMYKKASPVTNFTRSDLGIPTDSNPTVAFSVYVRLNTGITGGTLASVKIITNNGATTGTGTVNNTGWTKVTVSKPLAATDTSFQFEVGVDATAASVNPYSRKTIFYIDGVNFNRNGSATVDDGAFNDANSIFFTANNTEPYPIKMLDYSNNIIFGVNRSGSIYSSSSSTFDIGGALTQKSVSFTRFFVDGVEQFRVVPSYVLFGAGAANTGSAPDTTQSSGVLINTGTGALTSYYAGDDARAQLGVFSNVGGTRNRKFYVDTTGNGYFDGSADVAAADYAEMFEWQDGNPNAEDRVGKTVVIVSGSIIRYATEQDSPDEIIGVVSAKPAFVGDTAWNDWSGKYVTDEFGRPINISENPDEIVYQISEDYNPELDYQPRRKRKEWSPIGMVGKLRILKNEPKGSRWIKLRDISENVEEWLVR